MKNGKKIEENEIIGKKLERNFDCEIATKNWWWRHEMVTWLLFLSWFFDMQANKGMNQAKLARLQQNVRIGGKGTARRKRKTVHKSATGDDKKLQQTLKRLGVNNIPQVEEVNMFRNDGTVIQFKNPKGTLEFFWK